MDNEQYKKYVTKKMKKSSIVKDTAMAYVIGGGICTAGEFIKQLLIKSGLSEQNAATVLTIILIGVGGILTALGLYSKLGKVAGAGSIVPITGFSNSMVSPAMEGKSEGLVLGLAAKMFTVAGPVIVYGLVSGFLAGIYYYLLYFVF